MPKSNRNARRLPPGPRGKFKNLRNRVKRYPAFLMDLYEQYGDIVYFEIPFFKFCVVYSPELIKEVLDTRPDDFPVVNFAAMNDAVKYTPLTGLNGPEHRRKRPIMATGFAESRMGAYSEIVLAKAAAFRDRLKPGTDVDIQDETFKYVWDSLIACVMGRDTEIPHTAGRRLSDHGRLQLLLQFLPGSKLVFKLPFPAVVEVNRLVQMFDDNVYGAIRRAQEDSSHDGHDFIAHLVRAKDQGIVEWSLEDDRAIRDEVMVMLGYVDGPIGAVALAFFYLARYPDVRDRLEKELREVVGDRPLEVADFDRLTYARAFCTELLRIDPPAYVSLPRPIKKNLELGGYFLPKGTMVHTGAKAVQHRPEYWDDPGLLHPERWLADAPRRCPEPEHSYIPFGSGPHGCVAGGLATRIIVYGVATIIQRLRLEPKSREIPPMSNVGATILGHTPVSISARPDDG